MTQVITEQIENDIALLTLNNPDSLNAMGSEMAADFSRAVCELHSKRNSLRAIILTGKGKAFSAGGDLKMLEAKRSKGGETNRQEMLKFYNSFLGILDLGVPIIAAINGPAIGAGLCVACACDIRIAAPEAKMGFTFTKLGLHPGMGATYFVPQVLGHARASELLLTGRVISADEGLRIGLISEIFNQTNLIEGATSIAREIKSCGPEATRQLLTTLRRSNSFNSDLEHEALCQSINYANPEFAEGLLAVSERRPAKF